MVQETVTTITVEEEKEEKKEKKGGYFYSGKDQLCWKCARALGPDWCERHLGKRLPICSWEASLTPVNCWDAEPYEDTFYIKKCPLFVPFPKDYDRKKNYREMIRKDREQARIAQEAEEERIAKMSESLVSWIIHKKNTSDNITDEDFHKIENLDFSDIDAIIDEKID